MNKEEILKSEYEKFFASQEYEASNLCHTYKEVTLPAMDEYAKQQAIAFAEWMAAEGYITYDGFDRWIAPHNNNTVYSASQLYAQFLSSPEHKQ